MKTENHTRRNLISLKFFTLTLFYVILSGFVSHASEVSPDHFEADDTWETAKIILINYQLPPDMLTPGYEWRQFHNFHQYGDEDWVMFYGRKRDLVYRVDVNLHRDNCTKCDPVIEIYRRDKDALTFIEKRDRQTKGQGEWWEGDCESDGLYFIRITQYDSNVYGEETEYELMLTIPEGEFTGAVIGQVTPPVRTFLTTDGNGEAISTMPKGHYNMGHKVGMFSLTARAACYQTHITENVPVYEEVEEPTTVDITLTPTTLLGDANGDGEITPDALSAFKKYQWDCPESFDIPCVEVCCDVTGDGECTPEIALYFPEVFGYRKLS